MATAAQTDRPTSGTHRTTTDALSAPFDPREVKFKPQTVKGNKALAIAYVDVRAVEDRLDEVVGVGSWQDDYDVLQDGSVVCRLKVKLGGEWVTKTDVGSLSEQPDGGDRLKAAFSDALKRAAVKFGIGRYLYRLPAQWVDFDPAKKQIVRPPQLPEWATPKPANLPRDGQELHRRVSDHDARLAQKGRCARGALLAHVAAAGRQTGYADDMTRWPESGIRLAVEAVREFEAGLKKAG